MYNKILLPTDGSPSAAAAAEFACALLAGKVGISVTVLVVLSIAKAVKDQHVMNPTKVDEDIVKSKLRHAGRDIISHTQSLFNQHGLTADAIMEFCDDPGDRIIQIAREQNFDLIVMGSRGRSLVKELIMGSVSTKVLQKAECPVIIYKK
jgi:nucleotide-binding universal stress UspA family protein